MTIGDSFKRLVQRIQPTVSEVTLKNEHVRQISARLDKSQDLVALKRIGSHERGSAVHKHSDLDLLAVLSVESSKWGNQRISSETSLKKIRATLGQRFDRTHSERDGQAVVMHFSDGDIDVVPAIFKEMVAIGNVRRPAYHIPGYHGEWITTAPEHHAEFIDKANGASGNKFTYCIQLLKFWRECRARRTPLNSFHLELLFASEGTFGKVGATYQECVLRAFATLSERKCRPIRDPLGISGLVAAATSEAKLRAANEDVEFALAKARKAMAAELARNDAAARGYWSEVFNGEFPTA